MSNRCLKVRFIGKPLDPSVRIGHLTSEVAEDTHYQELKLGTNATSALGGFILSHVSHGLRQPRKT